MILPVLTYVQNWAVAIRASRTEQVVIIGFAVGFSIAFEEIAGSQLLGAMRTGEMFRMPRLPQSGDHLTDDRLLAGAAAALLASVNTLATHICLQIT